MNAPRTSARQPQPRGNLAAGVIGTLAATILAAAATLGITYLWFPSGAPGGLDSWASRIAFSATYWPGVVIAAVAGGVFGYHWRQDPCAY